MLRDISILQLYLHKPSIDEFGVESEKPYHVQNYIQIKLYDYFKRIFIVNIHQCLI